MNITVQDQGDSATRAVSARAAGVTNELSGAPACADTTGGAGAGAGKRSRLWLWFVAAFILQLCAWTAWFVIASQNRVAEVPLATSPVR